MKIVKVNLLFATLLSVTVGTVGCATAQQVNTASINPAQVIFDADQMAMNSETAAETTNANLASKSTSPATENLITTSPAVQIARASFSQAVWTSVKYFCRSTADYTWPRRRPFKLGRACIWSRLA